MSNKKRAADVKGAVTEEAAVSSEVEKPPNYRVFLINDDYTPMDFVVDVIMRFFELSEPEATMIMLQVHKQGRGVCGIFTRDVAETKVNLVNSFSRASGQPLLCQMEQV